MNGITKRITALLAACALLACAAGCGGEAESSAPVTEATTTTTTTAAPTTTTTTTQPPVELGLNLLTGEKDMATDNNRPIGFMVSDESSTLVQLGLESADMYVEAETEGGIPRILAIYSSVDRMPDAIGPVRSARPHFVRLAKALDTIYCHIGGSKSGLNEIKELGVTEMVNAYEIHSVLKNSANYSWNRSAFTKKKVMAQLGRIKTTSAALKSPFAFGDKLGSAAANTVDVKISASYRISFKYDSAKGVYVKNHNALSSGVHTTYTGGPITASNVIVMYAKRMIDPLDSNRCDFELTSGKGTLAVGGTCRDITWKVTKNGVTFYESDGTTQLTVAEGKTFICLTALGCKSETKMY